MCDPNLRIAYMAAADPGKMNDARAFLQFKGLNCWFTQLEGICLVVMMRIR